MVTTRDEFKKRVLVIVDRFIDEHLPEEAFETEMVDLLLMEAKDHIDVMVNNKSEWGEFKKGG